jgi:hypothetical protein
MKVNPKCKGCGDRFTPKYTSFEKYCRKDECRQEEIAQRKEKSKPNLQLKSFKAIPKVSKKRQVENLQYQVLRKEFLEKKENQTCFIDGCHKRADTIEHTAGRLGYYDDWARDNKVSLYLDVRFWKPCCLQHNLELENNPELSKKYQLSKLTGKPKN